MFSPMIAQLTTLTAGHVLFFDGVCGLCDRLVQLVLRHDRRQRFRFAALQGDVAAQTLGHYGKPLDVLDTVYVLTEDGRLLQKARAILFVMAELGLPWSLARLFAPLPTRVLDWFYDRVARNRYRLFGKRDACRLPTAEEKLRFLA
jgi:predicted DCC family thiol-disulfide oxidoreductase YuxK